MKNRLYMTTSDDELCGWMDKRLQSTSQSQTCSRKGSWSLFGGLLPVWSTTAFWIPAKPWHLRSMLSKQVRHIENCNACSQHQPTERARVLSMRMPECTFHNQHFKSWTNWATKFCLIHNIHLNSYHRLTLQVSPQLLQWKHFYKQQEAENAFKSPSNPEAQIFTVQE